MFELSNWMGPNMGEQLAAWETWLARESFTDIFPNLVWNGYEKVYLKRYKQEFYI